MILAVDLGHYSVKLILLEKNQDNYSITKFGSKALNGSGKNIEPDQINKSYWVAAVQNLFKELDINPKKVKNVISNLSSQNVIIKQISTLDLEAEELTNSLHFEAKKHIPMDGSDAILDFQILEKNKSEIDKINVILVATTKKQVNHHLQLIRETGLRSGIFDVDTIALLNCYLFNKELSPKGVDVILNIGDQSTSLIIWGKGEQFFNRDISIAGYHFTKEIMKIQSLNFTEADNLKRTVGVSSLINKNEKEIKQTESIQLDEQTIFTNLVDEIRKTLRYYNKTNNQTYFNRFFITGGSASLPGLLELINEKLNVEFEPLNPIEKIQMEQIPENCEQYSGTIGMAIRFMEGTRT